MIRRHPLLYCGEPIAFACDGRCDKAFGVNGRPRIYFDDAIPDDYAFLADGELGEAPGPGQTATPFEGVDQKPSAAPITDPAMINRWCLRECERGARDGAPTFSPTPPDLARRRYNQPWKHLDLLSDEEHVEMLLAQTYRAVAREEHTLNVLDTFLDTFAHWLTEQGVPRIDLLLQRLELDRVPESLPLLLLAKTRLTAYHFANRDAYFIRVRRWLVGRNGRTEAHVDQMLRGLRA